MCSSTTPRLRVGLFRSLNEGDEVEFTVTQDPKGPQAQAVKTHPHYAVIGYPPRHVRRDGLGVAARQHKPLCPITSQFSAHIQALTHFW